MSKIKLFSNTNVKISYTIFAIKNQICLKHSIFNKICAQKPQNVIYQLHEL